MNTGVCVPFTAEDYLGSTHRGHGHCIDKGEDPKLMMAEMFGQATGPNNGKGGSMHIADMSNGMLGTNGVIAASGTSPNTMIEAALALVPHGSPTG